MSERRIKPARYFRFLVLAVFIAFFLVGAWIVYVSVRDLPSLDQNSLRPVDPTVIYGADGGFITTLGDQRVIPVKLSQVPQVVKNAFLATEDIRFYQNSGIDLRSFARAAWHDLTTLSLSEGASTITQQLVKNAFLTPDRTMKYKIQEILLAFEITQRYSKDEILEMYLNKIYLGDGANGIGAAARVYFNKDVSQLSLPEAALIAGLPQAPTAYSPITHPDAAKRRRDEVLGKMLTYNLITEHEYQQAVAKEISLCKPPDTGEKYPYFIDYVVSQLSEIFGEDTVYRGGLKVYTTLSPKIQQALEKAFADQSNFPPSARDAKGILQPEGASVFLDPQTGAIRAMIGGREYTGHQVLNRAVQTYRQPGSSLKPLVAYGPAIEYDGMTPDSIVEDSPVRFGNYEPHNYDNVYLGPITLRTALTGSINVVAVKLLDMAGIPKAVKFAQGVGITSLDPQKEGLSMALGGLYKGVSPLEMAGAYGAIANCGIYTKPFVIDRVIDSNGKELYKEKPEIHQAMRLYTAAALTSMMQTAVTEGTGINAKLDDRPVAGKTGTSEDGRDLWFCGFSPRLAGVVWIGYDSPKGMPGQFGGMYPAQIWRQVMTASLAGEPVIQFQDLYPDIYPESAVEDTQPNDITVTPEDQPLPGNNPVPVTKPKITPQPGGSSPVPVGTGPAEKTLPPENGQFPGGIIPPARLPGNNK